jgi:hypothetical protein
MAMNTKEYMKGYMKEYFQIPENKEKRREYMRVYIRNQRQGLLEPKIKDVASLSSSIKKYSVNFPEKEFNEKLGEILKDNPSEVLEKKLKDVIYDILEKKGTLSMERLLRLYYGSFWENAIEEFMLTKNYEKNGEKKYILIQNRFIPQSGQI